MKEVLKQVKGLSLGDLVRVDWFDASIGKSLSNGVKGIDVPVQSWGIFLGILGDKNKHVILSQNNFRYADCIYDIDYTAVPVPWAVNITVIVKNQVQSEEAKHLLNSFLMNNNSRALNRRIKQQKVTNHDRLD